MSKLTSLGRFLIDPLYFKTYKFPSRIQYVIFAVNLPKTSFHFSISMSKMTSFTDGLWKDANYSITTYASSCTVQLCGA